MPEEGNSDITRQMEYFKLRKSDDIVLYSAGSMNPSTLYLTSGSTDVLPSFLAIDRDKLKHRKVAYVPDFPVGAQPPLCHKQPRRISNEVVRLERL